MSEDKKYPTDTQILFGGEFIQVTHKVTDPNLHEPPKKERLKVRLFDIEDIPQLLTLWGDDEGKLIEFLCQQKSGWHKLLTLQDQERILELGYQMNYPTAGRCLKRKQWVTALINENPVAQEVIKMTVATTRELLGSLSLPPSTPPLSEKAGPKS